MDESSPINLIHRPLKRRCNIIYITKKSWPLTKKNLHLNQSPKIFLSFLSLISQSCEFLLHLIQFIHRPGKVKCAMMNEIRSLEWRREDLSFSCIKLLAWTLNPFVLSNGILERGLFLARVEATKKHLTRKNWKISNHFLCSYTVNEKRKKILANLGLSVS